MCFTHVTRPVRDPPGSSHPAGLGGLGTGRRARSEPGHDEPGHRERGEGAGTGGADLAGGSRAPAGYRDGMGKAIGSWLSGPPTSPDRVQDWRGQRLGLPEQGAGSVASFGRRLAAFVIDGAAADVLTLLWGYRPGDRAYGMVVMGAFLAIELVFVAAFGQTPGMRLLRVRVATVSGGKPAARWVAVRTFLLALAIPALVIDRDNRGLHDRASATVVVRA